MKTIPILFIIGVLGFMVSPVSDASPLVDTEVIAYPSTYYVKPETFQPDDWVVEFRLPANAKYKETFCQCDRSKRPFSGSKSYVESNGRIVKVVAGGRAYLNAGYTIDQWAKVWRVKYSVPSFEPRGKPIKPRG
ncbi:MAG TPA: hypothetical protein VF599_10455 [Pyrinomonadaceae bacterium]|jgi:hypothetical protein